MPSFSAYSRYAYSSYLKNLSDACNKFIKPRQIFTDPIKQRAEFLSRQKLFREILCPPSTTVSNKILDKALIKFTIVPAPPTPLKGEALPKS